MALGVEKVGIEDDFFENGGTSLSASKVAMKCMSAGIGVSYADLFEYKTPLALERYLMERENQDGQSGMEEQAEEENLRQDSIGRILSRNTPEYADEVRPSAVGNVLQQEPQVSLAPIF